MRRRKRSQTNRGRRKSKCKPKPARPRTLRSLTRVPLFAVANPRKPKLKLDPRTFAQLEQWAVTELKADRLRQGWKFAPDSYTSAKPWCSRCSKRLSPYGRKACVCAHDLKKLISGERTALPEPILVERAVPKLAESFAADRKKFLTYYVSINFFNDERVAKLKKFQLRTFSLLDFDADFFILTKISLKVLTVKLSQRLDKLFIPIAQCS